MLSTAAASPVLVFVAYLLGSIPSGLILTKLFGGKDVREHGSGNIGATNVSRVAGPLAGILTLLLDVLKGAAAVLLAGLFTGHSALWMMLAGLAALVGHCFPVWLRFQGGKGVATALGVFALLCPLAAVAGLVLFLLVFVFWRYVSLASISAAAAMPLLVYLLWAPPHAPPAVVTFGALFAAALVIYKHKANLQRLLSGSESKYLAGKPKDGSA
jgi:acyl phosphate:glycerol-3-phosphate acyltransferase